MGLEPHGHSSGQPIPFPLEDAVIQRPHFFYVQYMDGGDLWAQKFAEFREDDAKGKKHEEWPKFSPKFLRDPVGHDLTNGSESKK